ncbi:hypothetical protein DTO282E5_4526 [Paecilomyces variotii]|nr:hypothetical protein DTO282E5_4526 [Paecilomyces variotii]
MTWFPSVGSAQQEWSPILSHCTRVCGQFFSISDAKKRRERQLALFLVLRGFKIMSSLTFALQALLHRHETYMAESEEDRNRLLSSVEQLEREKKEMQAENNRIIEENRGLLEQLEGLNKQVAESDTTIKSLTATLETTQSELRRMTAQAARAEELEAQLSAMESEQTLLQDQLSHVQEDERCAVQRWKKAECTLRDLHDQVDRIEKEAREEREKHIELMERMERRRAVERELDGAAGRLKGAAAASGLGRPQNAPTVVSKFVRDILQDNANLQIGIVELREMLQNSNEEVQHLREQMMLHQPLAAATDQDPSNDNKLKRISLSEELETRSARPLSQEYHVHHHYHAPATPTNPKKEKGLSRRLKKKRPMLPNPTAPQPVSGPRRPAHRHQSSSSTSTILSQTSVTVPPNAAHRWSVQSPVTAATSSIASSPGSGYRTSSIFDRIEYGGVEASLPTSPESNPYSSPIMAARRGKRMSDASFHSVPGYSGGELSLEDELAELDGTLDDMSGGESIAMQPPIPEETEESSNADNLPTPDRQRGYGHHCAQDSFSSSVPFNVMHRSLSNDSLLSVSGMDIHTLRDRPSQLKGLHSTYFAARTPRRIVSPSTLTSTSPIISTANITADRVPVRSSSAMSPHSLLTSVAQSHPRPATRPAPSFVSQESSDGDTPSTRPKTNFRRRVGSWVMGRWGIAPVKSTGDLRNKGTMTSGASTSSATSEVSATTEPTPAPVVKPPLEFGPAIRPPGVNQKGPIPGLRPPVRTPSQVHARGLDEQLLRESLQE